MKRGGRKHSQTEGKARPAARQAVSPPCNPSTPLLSWLGRSRCCILNISHERLTSGRGGAALGPRGGRRRILLLPLLLLLLARPPQPRGAACRSRPGFTCGTHENEAENAEGFSAIKSHSRAACSEGKEETLGGGGEPTCRRGKAAEK